jgi:hypothetical protein
MLQTLRNWLLRGEPLAAEISTGIGNVPQVKILDRFFVIFNAAASRLGKKSTESTVEYLENIMRDPKKTAVLMKDMSPTERQALSVILNTMKDAPIIAATQESRK